MNGALSRAAAVCLLFFSAIVPGRAAILFDNYTPGDPTYIGGGYGIGDDFYGGVHVIGEQFAITGSGNFFLTQITVPIGYGFGTNLVTLRLFTDSGTNVPGKIVQAPGALLETWTATVYDGPEHIMHPIVLSSAGTVLTGGKQYWLLAYGDQNESSFWSQNTVGGYGLRYQDGFINGASPSIPQGAFRVEGTAVPEPAVASLLILGTISAFRLRRAAPHRESMNAGTSVESAAELPPGYPKEAKRVAEEQAAKAGYRLADELRACVR
jgi:hypothetical protein